MLTLSDTAVMAIRNLTSQPEFPDDTGLRIMAQGETRPAYHVALAESPAEGDQVIQSDGARVFLDPGVALALSGMWLDAEVDDDGTVAFTLAEQMGSAGQPNGSGYLNGSGPVNGSAQHN